jgi:hypothetical protein
MKLMLLPAIALATLGAGCAYDPPFSDGVPKLTNACMADSGDQSAQGCGGDEASDYVIERERAGTQYYANQQAHQAPSATASVPAPQTSE